MSGHSKWNNIKRKKEKTDGAKAKVFTKIGREISVAVRTGGPNPASNSKLADLISKAKRMSVPNDNIQRIIKKVGTAIYFHLTKGRAKKTEEQAMDNLWLELPWWFL